MTPEQAEEIVRDVYEDRRDKISRTLCARTCITESWETMTKPYRYEATIRLVIYADGQDAAWQMARDATAAARVDETERATVERVSISIMDLHYRPTVREQWTGNAR